MTLEEALQRVYELAEARVEYEQERGPGSPKTQENQEALDTFHDFVVNCPWLE
jgi:hypothetical protein